MVCWLNAPLAHAKVMGKGGCIAFCSEEYEILDDTEMKTRLTNAVYYNREGLKAVKIKDYKAAKTHFRKSLHYVGDYKYAKDNLANILNAEGVDALKKQHYAQAILLLEEALRVDPKREDITHNLFVAEKKKEEAGRDVRLAEALNKTGKNRSACQECNTVFLQNVRGVASSSDNETIRQDVIDEMTGYNECLMKHDVTCKAYCGFKIFNQLIDNCEYIKEAEDFRRCVVMQTEAGSNIDASCI
jgi:tetratricopeptide (TPR) repeat protein